MSDARPALPITSGHASEQGVRPTMEDEVIVKESFQIPHRGTFSFYGVFDGHGGSKCARFTRDHLFDLLHQELTNGVEPSEALTRAYLATDQRFIALSRGEEVPATTTAPTAVTAATAPANLVLPSAPAPAVGSNGHRRQQSANLAVRIPTASLPPQSSAQRSASAVVDHAPEKDTSGTTAVTILIHHDTYTLYCGNCGDSRAVLAGAMGVVALTRDHKADRPDEVDRIRRAGGFVVHKRVMGELAISRAIGDLDFKEKGFLFVLPDPELCTYQLGITDEFIILACDGVYDVMSNEQVCGFIRDSFASGLSPTETASKLTRHAIETLNTRDNVTVIIVKLPSQQQLANVGFHPKSTPASHDTLPTPTRSAQLRAPHFHDSHPLTPGAPARTSPDAQQPQATGTATTIPPSVGGRTGGIGGSAHAHSLLSTVAVPTSSPSPDFARQSSRSSSGQHSDSSDLGGGPGFHDEHDEH